MIKFSSKEKYSRGWRGAPAKGVGRSRGARVQIPLSPFHIKMKMNLDTLRIPFFRPGLWSNKISTEQYKKGVDKERAGWYDKTPPRKSGGDEIKKSQKKIKKMLTNDKTHDIISELRREIQHRTLTNKQQCNPENSK